MNGKRARRIRRAIQYKKSPDHLVEPGGLVEEDGKLYFKFARNDHANQYRWWKRGVSCGKIAPELINHLAHRQAPHHQTTLDDLSNGEENE